MTAIEHARKYYFRPEADKQKPRRSGAGCGLNSFDALPDLFARRCSARLNRTPPPTASSWTFLLGVRPWRETYIRRGPPSIEKEILERIKAHLENEGVVAEAELTSEELRLIESHAFVTAKPIVPEPADAASFDNLWSAW